MDNTGRSWQQVAAEASVAPEVAMTACYLANCAREGKSLDQAAQLLRKDRSEARSYARDWGIRFVDYVTAPQPLALVWTKPKRGLWTLMLGDVMVAEATPDGNGTGGYGARKNGEETHYFGSSAEIAIRRLSANLEARSVEIFGVDDVSIAMDLPDGRQHLVPPEAVGKNLSAALGEA